MNEFCEIETEFRQEYVSQVSFRTLIQSRVFTNVFTRYTHRRKTKFRQEYVYRFLFSLLVEFLNHVNKFRVQYKLYVFKDLKVRNKFETE